MVQLFVRVPVIVAVDDQIVVVLVRVPVRSVLPFTERSVEPFPVVMGHVVMIVRVDDRAMGMCRLVPDPFHPLLDCFWPPSTASEAASFVPG
jgi:hypothetical protein